MKHILFLFLLLFFLQPLHSQRQMEHLDRGVVAINKGGNSLFVSWRFFADDPDDIAFNVYRRIGYGTPVKLNSSPVTNKTNLLWSLSGAGLNIASRIYVKPVINGVEGEEEGSWELPANVPACRIVRDFDYEPLQEGHPDMSMKFCWPADLDGDGKYDYMIDRQNYGGSLDEEGGSNATDYPSPKIEAYTSEGVFLWRVDMGYNVKIDDGHNDMVTAYDMDGDGKAEVLMAVSEGTTFPDGTVITGANGTVTDYRTRKGSAPQWVAIVNGQTGNPIDKIELTYFDEIATERTDNQWKNIGGHFIIAYLDGIRPSLIYQYKNRQTSGGFTGAYDAWHYAGGKLVKDWSRRFLSESTEYEAHQIRVADVDGDGKDEFVEISYAIDHDGSLLYQVNNIGHGDRHCLADIDPDRPGPEQFFIQQTNIMGMGLFDATNGEMITSQYLSALGDVGRGICGAFDPNRRGMQYWSTMNSNAVYDCKGNLTGATGTFPAEAVWWGGDLARWELIGVNSSGSNIAFVKINAAHTGFDRDMPNLYNEDNGHGAYYFAAAYGARAAFWGDILGDWREELVLARNNGTGFVVLSTWEETPHRIYCLMQNPAYRGQTTARGYYQTADVDFYMAADMPKPPIAPVQTADVYFTSNTLTATVANGKSVMVDLRNPNSTISLNENITPTRLWLMNPKGKNYTFSGTGKLTGTTNVVKSQQGDVVFNGNYDYTGVTRISEGRLFVNGTLASPVQVDARGVIGGNATLNGGVTLETGLNVEGGRIEPGNGADLGTLTIVGNLLLPGRNNLAFDIDQTQPAVKNDKLNIQGNFTVTGTNHSIIVNPLTSPASETLTLITFTGTSNATADNFSVKGLEGIPYTLIFEANAIKITFSEPRSPGNVVWTGAHNAVWDFNTKNFLNETAEDIFVPGDAVTFNDDAINKTITLNEAMPVSGMAFTGDADYKISGNGNISGSGGLTKTGTGKLSLLTSDNTFTGPVDIDGGVLEVSSLKNGGLPSSIGASSGDAANWIMRNATLQSASQMATDRNMQIVGKLTVHNPTASTSVMIGGNITGNGALEITGAGTLNLQGINTFSSITVKSGLLALGSVSANSQSLGNATVTLEGGSLRLFDVNSTGSTGPFTNTINVPEGASVHWYLPQRWRFTNKLTGNGTIEINAPYVRSDFNNDWSGFTGTIKFTGRDIRLNNASAQNLSGASVDLGSGAWLYVASNGSGEASNGSTIRLGALSGSGGIAGKNTLIIGTKNLNTTYSGVISAGSGKLTKNGAGTLTLSGANLYTGGTEITGGKLLVANIEGSATGTGNVTVTNGARLGGTGSIDGNVTVYADSYLDLQNNQCKSITIKRNLMLNNNANAVLEVNPSTLQSDVVNVVDLSINGNLEMVKLGNSAFQAGMTFKIFNASGSVTGTFTQITAPLPDGLAWDQSRLSEGILSVSAITSLSPVDAEGKTVKAVEYYNLTGITVSEDARGFVLKKTIYNDNTIIIEKTFKK